MPQLIFASPIGSIQLLGDGRRLTAVRIGGNGVAADDPSDPLLENALAQLQAYFERRLTNFDLPLADATSPRGAEHRHAIASVSYSETASYGEIAHRIGSGPRAVGQACRRNPFPIIIPCHRVLGAGQAIGQYSAGDGTTTKAWLLAHERP